MVEISEVAPTSIVQAQDITNNCAISGVSGNMIVSKGDASAGAAGQVYESIDQISGNTPHSKNGKTPGLDSRVKSKF